MANVRPSARKVKAERERRVRIRARRGIRVATTTEVIGEGDLGLGA